MVAEALTSSLNGSCRTQRVVLPDGERTWTVLDGDHGVVEPAEQYLEYLRMLGRSPNTVKSYARALALVVAVPDVYALEWDGVTVEDLGRFLGWLRSGDEPALAVDRAPAGAVQRGHDRAAAAGGVLVLSLPPLQRCGGRVAAL